jgi:hypothetical protein
MPTSKRAPSSSRSSKAAYSPIDIETNDYSIVATAPDTLSMTCPATSEGVLKLFSNPILVHEVEKNPHIESQFHVVGKNFEIEFKADASTVKKIVSFDALKHANLTDDIKVAAHERKFFVRNAHSMKDYIVKLKKGIITHYTHHRLIGAAAGFAALTGAAFLLHGKMRDADHNGRKKQNSRLADDLITQQAARMTQMVNDVRIEDEPDFGSRQRANGNHAQPVDMTKVAEHAVMQSGIADAVRGQSAGLVDDVVDTADRKVRQQAQKKLSDNPAPYPRGFPKDWKETPKYRMKKHNGKRKRHPLHLHELPHIRGDTIG